MATGAPRLRDLLDNFDILTYWCSNDRLPSSSRLRLNDCVPSMSVDDLGAPLSGQETHRISQRQIHGIRYPD